MKDNECRFKVWLLNIKLVRLEMFLSDLSYCLELEPYLLFFFLHDYTENLFFLYCVSAAVKVLTWFHVLDLQNFYYSGFIILLI